jgi:hypothetical protein
MSRTLHSGSSTRGRGQAATCALVVLCFAIGNAPTARVYGQRAAKAPSFETYRVPKVYSAAVKPPAFGALDGYSGTDLQCFGQDPETYAAMHVNFAGHFVISACSCGSGCRYLFLWDAQTGKVYRQLPFGPINVGPYGVGGTTPPVRYAGEQYRADSSLLMLDGCFEETCDCAKRYYAWSGSHFKLIHREPDRLPPDCVH